jgi:hypothetical protein
MEQHPVPQQITSYQFRLVGDMTLKQFFQVAGGGLIGLLIYASNLPVIIKWPLIIIFVLLGIALAFLPFQERPLEDWIIAFFRAIYMPTSYTWTKTRQVKQYFQQEEKPTVKVIPEEVVAPYGKTAMEQYLKTPADQKQQLVTKLEDAEKEFLSKTLKLFKPGVQPAVTEQRQEVMPLQPVSVKPQVQEVKTQAATQSLSYTPPISPPASKATIQPKPRQAAPVKPKPVKKELAPLPKVVIQEAAPIVPEKKEPKIQGFTPPSIPMPVTHKPTTPTSPSIQNTISGQILDNQGKIVEGAILEVKDSAGRPVRALKSNKVGHFLTVTPLLNGLYEIVTEKEGLTFAPITFEAKGEIISPLTIQARSGSVPDVNVVTTGPRLQGQSLQN